MSSSILKGLTATAVILAVSSFAFGVSAQDKKAPAKAAPKPPACKTIKDEAACKAREVCTWVAATMKGKVTVRKAHCRAKPAPKKK